jgi:hypothetical protein
MRLAAILKAIVGRPFDQAPSFGITLRKGRNSKEFSGGTKGRLEKSTLGGNEKMLSPTIINDRAMQAAFPTSWRSELQYLG